MEKPIEIDKVIGKFLQKNQTFSDRLLLIAHGTLRQIMEKEIRILILEELPARAALIEAQLQEADIPFFPKTVQTRDDFIREVHDFAPDVILSAYYLPGFTGSEALAIAHKEAPGVPFILVTGKLKEEHWVEVLTEGAAYVLEDKLSKLPSILQRVLRPAKHKKESTEKCNNHI